MDCAILADHRGKIKASKKIEKDLDITRDKNNLSDYDTDYSGGPWNSLERH